MAAFLTNTKATFNIDAKTILRFFTVGNSFAYQNHEKQIIVCKIHKNTLIFSQSVLICFIDQQLTTASPTTFDSFSGSSWSRSKIPT